MSSHLTQAEEEAITRNARRSTIRVPVPDPWTLILIGFRSGKEMTRLRHPGAPPELWLPSPLADGPRQIKARRVQLDSSNRMAYYTAGRLDLKSEIEARAAAGQKELPEVSRKRGRR